MDFGDASTPIETAMAGTSTRAVFAGGNETYTTHTRIDSEFATTGEESFGTLSSAASGGVGF